MGLGWARPPCQPGENCEEAFTKVTPPLPQNPENPNTHTHTRTHTHTHTRAHTHTKTHTHTQVVSWRVINTQTDRPQRNRQTGRQISKQRHRGPAHTHTHIRTPHKI